MPVQRFAQVFGAVYLLGFAFRGFANFAGTSDDKLLLFGVNPALGLYFGLAGRRTVASTA